VSDPANAAYRVDGERVFPTDRARGPWSAEQQHGSAVLALLTRFLERVPSAQPMRLTRVTADLSRAVPMTELTVHAQPYRDGKRVQGLEAFISADGVVVARATATRIRVEPGLIAKHIIPLRSAADDAPPFGTYVTSYTLPYASFHDLLEVMSIDGADGYDTENSARHRTWYRLAGELVAGEAPSGVVRLAAAADMIGSAARFLGPDWMSINPEVMLQVERDSVGEWICTDSIVRFGDDGVGMSSAVMSDSSGRVGASAKSLLNTPR
jgi:acyl-coenzyme A thioesterase PaaI-like protein